LKKIWQRQGRVSALMKIKFKHWLLTIPPISTKQTITSHLNTLNIKRPWHIMFEIKDMLTSDDGRNMEYSNTSYLKTKNIKYCKNCLNIKRPWHIMFEIKDMLTPDRLKENCIPQCILSERQTYNISTAKNILWSILIHYFQF
jgi:hypothetical protein